MPQVFRSISKAFAILCLGFPLCLTSQLAVAPDALRIDKIDPPNWYVQLPSPMLLVKGEGFSGAHFSLSNSKLNIARTEISANGHYAQLFLTASPEKPETVTLRVMKDAAFAEQPYTFAARRAAADGMAGLSTRDILYLIMVDRFADGDPTNDGANAHHAADSADAAAERAKSRGWHGGDITGIRNHLDYLQSLGVTAIWTTPLYQNYGPEAYHGYHATDYYSVDEHYGTLAQLQLLADELHRRGMKLILDDVPNHVGPFHPWVDDPPAPYWFHGSKADHLDGETNFDALINPHAPPRDSIRTLEGWFAGNLPDLNTDNPNVALYLRQNAVWWIEQTGADGYRIDTFPYVDRAFWNAYDGELKTLYPRLTEVGEVSNPDPEIVSAFADGVTRAGVDTRLYTPFDFPLYFAAVDVFGNGQPFSRLTRVLEADELYPHPERLAPFLSNHDRPRLASAISDRAQQALAWAFLLTTRGTPQLYSGDEIGLTGAGDPENRSDFPGGFPAANTRSAWSASDRNSTQQEDFAWVQQLIALRAAHSSLQCGAEQVLLTSADSMAYARFGNNACSGVLRGDSRAIIVLLQRHTPVPFALDLNGTVIAACANPEVLTGVGAVAVSSGRLQVAAKTQTLVVACN